MSSRHLKRVLGGPSLEGQPAAGSDDEQETVRDVAKPSAFDLLMDSDDDDDGSESETEHDSPEEEVGAEPNGDPVQQVDSEEKDSDEEFEEALKVLKGSDHLDDERHFDDDNHMLLAPCQDQMNPLAELKKKIGNFNVNPQDDQRMLGLIPGRTGHVKKAGPVRMGRSQLVPQNPAWPAVPAAAVGLKVSYDRQSETFVLEHSERYLEGLRMAVIMIRQADIEGLLAMIRHGQHPFQVDSLLVISDYIRMSGGSGSEAAELVEWSLFLMERSFPGSGFLPFKDVKRRGSLMLYEIPENRKMHLALFRHCQHLLKKGCYRSAMEYGKLMLCLDLDDPLFIKPLLAFSALQAKQYDWIIDVAGSEFQQDMVWRLTVALTNWYKGEKDMATGLLLALLEDYPSLHGFLSAGETSSSLDTHIKVIWRVVQARFAPILKDPSVSRWLQAVKPEATEDGPYLDLHAPVYRHVLLSDLPNLNIPLPKAYAQRELNVYDPISPEAVEAVGRQGGIISSLADTLARLLGRS